MGPNSRRQRFLREVQQLMLARTHRYCVGEDGTEPPVLSVLSAMYIVIVDWIAESLHRPQEGISSTLQHFIDLRANPRTKEVQHVEDLYSKLSEERTIPPLLSVSRC